MTWTVTEGMVPINRYVKIDKTMIWVVQVNGSNAGGVADNLLHLTPPPGITLVGPQYNGAVYLPYAYDAGGALPSLAYVTSPTIIGLQKANATNWSGFVSIWVTITVQVA